MAIDKLGDIQTRKVQPRQKVFRIHDGLGLYLEVTPTGNRWWRFRTEVPRDDQPDTAGKTEDE